MQIPGCISARVTGLVGDALIVEDHGVVSGAMQDFIRRRAPSLNTLVCATAPEALAALAAPGRQWVRIFLDLDVPGALGLSLVQAIKDHGYGAQCCVVSATDREDFVTQVHALGCLGYVVKATRYEEFEAAIDRVLSGERSFPLAVRRANLAPVRLTQRQAEFLGFVRDGRTSKEIAASCGVSEGTVNNIVAAASHALGASTRAAAVATAVSLGLLADQAFLRHHPARA